MAESDLRAGDAATVKIGPYVDSDGLALTLLTPVPTLSKGDGAFGARSSAGAISHDADGFYQCPLDATDTGTVGKLTVQDTDAAHMPVVHVFRVLDPAVYDVLYGSTAPSTLGGVAQTGDSFARIGAAGAGLTNVPWNSAWAAQVKAALLTLFQSLMRSDVTEDSDIGGTFDSATDSLQAIRDRGDNAWTTATTKSDFVDNLDVTLDTDEIYATLEEV